jgi:hypothetical protein
VDVRYDEIRIMDEEVDRGGRHENAAQSADDEHRNEGQGEEHRCGEFNRAAPNRAHPVECFDPNTQILTWEGEIKLAKDIVVGDYLLNDEGKPTKVICRSLNMSEGTAKVHISAILRAFQVRNRAEAVVAALRMGWIQTVVGVATEPQP